MLLYSKHGTIFSASRITKSSENLGINISLHFKDQEVGSRKDFSPIRYEKRKLKKKNISVFPQSACKPTPYLKNICKDDLVSQKCRPRKCQPYFIFSLILGIKNLEVQFRLHVQDQLKKRGILDLLTFCSFFLHNIGKNFNTVKSIT